MKSESFSPNGLSGVVPGFLPDSSEPKDGGVRKSMRLRRGGGKFMKELCSIRGFDKETVQFA
ncbi:MAG: hypothetical protein R2942_00045 [Ignavibacteria bacterium]